MHKVGSLKMADAPNSSSHSRQCSVINLPQYQSLKQHFALQSAMLQKACIRHFALLEIHQLVDKKSSLSQQLEDILESLPTFRSRLNSGTLQLESAQRELAADRERLEAAEQSKVILMQILTYRIIISSLIRILI